MAFGFRGAVDAQASRRQRLEARRGNVDAALCARGVFTRLDPMQRPRDLPQLFGDFDVERLEQFLIFEFGRLFGEVLRERFVPVSRFPGDAVVALEQLVFPRQ